MEVHGDGSERGIRQGHSKTMILIFKSFSVVTDGVPLMCEHFSVFIV